MARIWIDEPFDNAEGLRVSATEVRGGWDQNRDGYEVDEDTARRWIATQDAWDTMQGELAELQEQHRNTASIQERQT